MSSLSSYLAKNYLTPSSNTTSDLSDRPKKRRKKDKHSSEPQSLVIADDDDLLLSGRQSTNGKVNEDEDGPLMYDGQMRSAEFRKKRQSGWKTISTSTDQTTTAADSRNGPHDRDREDDRILQAAAAADTERRKEIEMEDAPAIVEDPEGEAGQPRMSSGVKAGLQTAADTAALAEKEEIERRAEERALRKARKKGEVKEEEETIYRDATGRRIDVSLKRAEIRKAQQEEERKKKKEREDAMGDVQRQQKEERKQELDDAKFLTLGRGEEDEEMNDRMKAEVRWDDPMAAYVMQRQAEERGAVGGVDDGGSMGVVKTVPKKKVYQGAAPPNRYGIAPGWRWDGVDRGNGFEKDWFQARSKKSRNEELSYQWAMDE